MTKFLIEREIPQVGSLDRAGLQAAAKRSNDVLRQLGPDIQWVQSYVAADKLFCIYHATSEALIYEHAKLSGFPASKVTRIDRIIDPATASGHIRSAAA